MRCVRVCVSVVLIFPFSFVWIVCFWVHNVAFDSQYGFWQNYANAIIIASN